MMHSMHIISIGYQLGPTIVMVSLLYEQRSGAGDLQSNPTVHALLSPLRVWRF